MEKISSQKRKTATVIGAGLAGLTLACELVDRGYAVTVLEKNNYLGGRASNTTDSATHDPVPIGPHVLVTAYRNFRRFLHKIEAPSAISWERKLFLEIIYKQKHHRISFSRVPDPFSTLPSFLTYPFMTWGDKISHLGFAARVLLGPRDIKHLDDASAYEYLRKLGVTENAIDKFWRFFVLSLLNVPIERCSAAEFWLLARYFAHPKQRKFGFVRVGLGDLYTDKATEYIERRGGRILRNASVTRIATDGTRISHIAFKRHGAVEQLSSDVYIATLTPVDLRKVIPENIRFSDFLRHLNAFEGVPYISVNLWFDRKISDKKFWALLNTEDTPATMNTDFYDQSNIYATKKDYSLITSNIIFSAPYEAMTDEEIIRKTLAEIKEVFPHTKAKLSHARVHRTPYAIYAPYQGMRRHKLPHKTPLGNFYLAGDWTAQDLPQCMEAAVTSGYECAAEILADDDRIELAAEHAT